MKKFACMALSVVFAGCASSSSHKPSASALKSPPANGGIYRQDNEGYSILYKLMHDESRVGGIFLIHKADPGIEATIKEVGLACQAAQKRLDDFRKMDSRLDFDVPGLPYTEQRSRDLEAKEDQHLLLFSSGKQFELTLIFTQAQAMNYAVNLCKALAEKETNPDRNAFLMDLQQQCTTFHERLMKLLAVA